MIGYLKGNLLKKEEERILLLVNQVGYEVLLPAIVMESIQAKAVGDELSFYIYYHQTDRQPKPLLIGFNSEIEKEFFQYFISVEAIGVMKAVKAMNVSVGEIADAIESEDAGKLKSLKGIGARTSHKIIATLRGKMAKFALIQGEGQKEKSVAEDVAEQVLDVLVSQLGHKSADAKQLITDAIKRNSNISTPEELFDEIYRGNAPSA
ncbi:Holliday junction branch migration protein RuvA [Desulfococcaceae bacterium HSG8]|nr:Holliday junction branch migration protein RuvA [Desulfococcaceae bacterium HSG8]